MKDRLSPFMKDILSGVLALAFAVWLLIGCTKMASYSTNLLRPDFIPRWIAYLLVVLAGITIVRAFIRRKKEGPMVKAEPEPESEKVKLTRAQIFNEFVPYLTFVLIGLYLWLMSAIGFAVASCLYLMAQINLLEQKRTVKRVIINCIIAIVIAVVVFLLFSKGFHMRLPTHRWGKLGKF